MNELVQDRDKIEKELVNISLIMNMITSGEYDKAIDEIILHKNRLYWEMKELESLIKDYESSLEGNNLLSGVFNG